MPTSDPNADILQFSNELFDKTLDPTRQIQERLWFRNILFLIGEQWISFDMTRNVFKRMFLNPFEPTPVDNIIREFCRSMIALILGKEYKVSIWPNSSETKDKAASQIGQDLLSHIESDNDEEFLDEMEQIILWLCLGGTGFCRTFPMLDKAFQYGIDKTGGIIKGAEIYNQCIMPFAVVVDEIGHRLRQKRWVGIESLKPKEWVEDTFQTKVKTSDSETGHINYQKRLAKLIGSLSPWKGAGIEPNVYDKPADDLCLLREIEFAPTKKHPNGRYVGIIGQGQLLFDHNKLPIPVEKDRWFYSITDFHYLLVPGRFWADPGVNDQLHHQKIINDIDQAAIKHRKGIGQPKVITTPDMTLRRLNDQGSSFVLLEYDPLLSGGQQPSFQSGEHFPTQYYEERSIHVASAQSNASDPKGVLRGQTPQAQASGVMVDILKEAAEASHGPDIKRFYRSKGRVFKKNLVLAKYVYTTEKTIKVAGKGSDVSVKQFKGSDLRGNTDVRLEMASGISTTNAGKVELLFKAQEGGFFGDLQTDPETRQEFLNQLGLAGFKHKFNVDIDRAVIENTLVSNKSLDEIGEEDIKLPNGQMVTLPSCEGIYLAVPNPDMQGQEGGDPLERMMVLVDEPLFKYDNHKIHYEIHRRFILSEEFSALDPILQDILMAHTDIHHMLMKLEVQAEQQAMMEMEQGGKPQPQGEEEVPIV